MSSRADLDKFDLYKNQICNDWIYVVLTYVQNEKNIV
jgi:hypothetical protein